MLGIPPDFFIKHNLTAATMGLGVLSDNKWGWGKIGAAVGAGVASIGALIF